jgi:hypothetical protein
MILSRPPPESGAGRFCCQYQYLALFPTGPRLEAATSPFGVLNTVG